MAGPMEIPGVVMGILPSLITASKDIRRVARQESWASELQTFHETFWLETVILQKQLGEFTSSLPSLHPNLKAQLRNGLNLALWTGNQNVESAIRNRLGTDGFDAFTLVCNHIVSCIEQIFHDDTTFVSDPAHPNEQPYEVVKRIAVQGTSLRTVATLQERLNFFAKTKRRQEWVIDLEYWNTKLKRILSSNYLAVVLQATSPQIVFEPADRRDEFAIASQAPYFLDAIRRLFGYLARTLEQYWTCNCSPRHESMLCLRALPSSLYLDSLPQEVNFELLFPRRFPGTSSMPWLESTVLVQEQSKQRDQFDPNPQKQPVSCICGLLVEDERNCLRLLISNLLDGDPGTSNIGIPVSRDSLVESDSSLQTLAGSNPSDADSATSTCSIWRLRPTLRKYDTLSDAAKISLEQYIDDGKLKRLREKRLLALNMAYSVLQSISYPGFNLPLEKSAVYFYTLKNQKYDLERPYRKTDFRTCSTSPQLDFSVPHQFPILLELGILLLEIHNGRSLMSSHEQSELQDTSPTARLQLASTEAPDLDMCGVPYINAILACLKVHWVVPGRLYNIDDPEISAGLYNYVIKPLEEEIKCLFPDIVIRD